MEKKWIEDFIFSQKQWCEVKNTLKMDVSSFSLHKILIDCNGVVWFTGGLLRCFYQLFEL